MSNLLVRIVTGIAYGGSIIAGLMLGKISSTLLFLAIMIVALSEFYSIVENDNTKTQRILGYLLSIGIFFSSYLFFVDVEQSQLLINLCLLLSLCIFSIELFTKKELNFNNIALTLTGVIYIALPLSLTIFLNHNSINEYDYSLLLAIFILIWLSDTGGYFVGMKFGKHKLHETISPKKSWEGVLGGLLFNIVGSFILSLFMHAFNTIEWMAIGSVVCIASVIGDLVESYLKRSVGVKDSGRILPGHGGMLDRIDSALFVIPTVYIFINLIQ